MKFIKNPLLTLFSNYEIIDLNEIELFHKGTRDIKEINVLIDNDSGSIILDKCVKDLNTYYLNKPSTSKEEHKTLIDNKLISPPPLEDDLRRFQLYKKELKDLQILDFGCGRGGLLKKLKNQIFLIM